jgi:dihydroorotate dehydrogenase (NAD+) catalytic subunit
MPLYHRAQDDHDKMTDLAVRVGRLKLLNPVLVASGTFGYAEEFTELMDCSKLGGVITKTITMHPRQGNKPPRIVETPSGMLNAIGLQNEGLDDFIARKFPRLQQIKTALIVSIAADTPMALRSMALRLGAAGVAAIELNLSCPNIHAHAAGRRLLVAQDPKATFRFVRAARSGFRGALIAKLSPNVTDIVSIAQAAHRAGADGLSLVNTLYGMSINIETATPRLGNTVGGLSGPAIRPLALKLIFDVAQSVKIPIIGMGGIMTWQDAVECMIAGASAVCIGTANFVDPAASIAVLQGLGRYCARRGIRSVKKLTASIRL